MQKLILFVAACALLSGCGAPALHGVYSKENVIHDEGLIGTWTGENVEATAIVREGEQSGYSVHLAVSNKGEQMADLELDLVLLESGEARLIDLFLSRSAREKLVEQYGVLAVPVHQVMLLERREDRLRVWPLNSEWAKAQAAGDGGVSGQSGIHVGGGHMTLITMGPEELFDLLRGRNSNSAAFGESIEFTRTD